MLSAEPSAQILPWDILDDKVDIPSVILHCAVESGNERVLQAMVNGLFVLNMSWIKDFGPDLLDGHRLAGLSMTAEEDLTISTLPKDIGTGNLEILQITRSELRALWSFWGVQ